MKKSLILAASVFLFGCATGSFPQFPAIKFHYVTEIKNAPMPTVLLNAVVDEVAVPIMLETQVARCLKFEIVSQIPYQIKFLSEVDLFECNGVGGYKAEDSISLYNWAQDVSDWAKTRRHCFKN